MADEEKSRAQKVSMAELEERVKLAELQARELEAKLRFQNAKKQLFGNRQQTKEARGAKK